ncbi:MAG: RHS repeat-associated core domain-containing protein [Saprospiraceae bacterium]|nr:RHS repeat-associated core domain-containing protein [Saprospiraceae bacterium]
MREIEDHSESMAEQKLGGYSSRYRFTGKELDPLSGLYDFGARYYDPRLSVWFGVDPLAEKNFAYTPYVYTGNNPIKFIDPDGQDWYEDKSSGKMQWFDEAGSKMDLFIEERNIKMEGIYTITTSDGKSPLSFDNALPSVDVTASRNEYKYPKGFVGGVNKTINNLFDNKPSDETRLREPGAFGFALKKTFKINLQVANIASTATAIGGGVGVGVKAFQAGNKGLALFHGIDVGLNSAGLATQAMGIESKWLNILQSGFGTKGLYQTKSDGFKLENLSDLIDVINQPPFEVQNPLKK